MPRSFQELIGQDRAARMLTAFIRRQTVPHALLFVGIDGVGKRTAARIFAAAANCEGDPETPLPCGECRPCRKIEGDRHPDVHTVLPSGVYIKIGQIRELRSSLAMKPYEGRTRVVIIRDAQAMQAEAANALLKVLEEPPDRTVLILTAEDTTDLLPTIVSRCQPVRFGPIPRDVLTPYLTERAGFTPEAASAAAALAHGSLARALALKRSDGIRRRRWLLDELEQLARRPPAALLAFAERLSKNRDAAAEALDVIFTWLRDLLVVRYAPSRILNADRTDRLREIAPDYPVGVTLERLDAVESARLGIRGHANLRLTLETLAFQLAGRLPGGAS